MKRKAIFLDRDGTVIVDKIYLNDPGQIEYLPGVFEALRNLRDAGFDFVIATNQSGVARGIVQLPNLWEIHRRMRADFSRHGIDFLGFYYAPFMTDSDHWFRKPNAGMLVEAANDFNIDLNQSWMVGDRMTDVEAGHRAGTKTVLLGSNESPENSPYLRPEIHTPDLLRASQIILSQYENLSR